MKLINKILILLILTTISSFAEEKIMLNKEALIKNATINSLIEKGLKVRHTFQYETKFYFVLDNNLTTNGDIDSKQLFSIDENNRVVIKLLKELPAYEQIMVFCSLDTAADRGTDCWFP
tara:strand:+ start:107 stop:463 length:357 start_codon:yes stop_codon:yes gene_type:complete